MIGARKKRLTIGAVLAFGALRIEGVRPLPVGATVKVVGAAAVMATIAAVGRHVVPWWVALAFGLCVGSFLNVVIWRVPRNESVVRPRSHCPGCGTEIHPRDNVPVVSYLLLRGRCRHCGATAA